MTTSFSHMLLKDTLSTCSEDQGEDGHVLLTPLGMFLFHSLSLYYSPSWLSLRALQRPQVSMFPGLTGIRLSEAVNFNIVASCFCFQFGFPCSFVNSATNFKGLKLF